ncbi:MAG: hypothetical protein QM704_03375 [Anaeromyxobacteraceae bacterium]
MRRALLPAALGALLAACATSRPAAPDVSGLAGQVWPEACREPVRRAVAVGRQLALQDMLQRWAVAALVHSGLSTKALVASIVTNDGRGWVVHELARDAQGAPYEAFRVAFERTAPEAARLMVVDPPGKLDPETALFLEIHERATAQAVKACTDDYAVAILPGATVGEDDWQVYLLARGEEEEWVLGGHVLRTVSPDGARVVADRALSALCATTRVKSGFAYAKDPTACPREVHVYAALLHRNGLVLDDGAGRWRIQADGVEFLAAPGQKPGEP